MAIAWPRQWTYPQAGLAGRKRAARTMSNQSDQGDDQAYQALTQAELLEMTAEIVAAYVGNNATDAGALPALIQQVHGALAGLAESSAAGQPPPRATPAVPIAQSVTDDHIVCLEDGRKLKVLKRYLRSHYNLTPAQYRARWGLPADYPMVAPSYSRARAEFARGMGLGHRAQD